VEIHANVIDNILNQRFLKHGFPPGPHGCSSNLFSGFPWGSGWRLFHPRWMWFGVALFVPMIAINFWAFLHGWWLNLIVPALTLSTNVLLVSLYRSLFEEKENAACARPSDNI